MSLTIEQKVEKTLTVIKAVKAYDKYPLWTKKTVGKIGVGVDTLNAVGLVSHDGDGVLLFDEMSESGKTVSLNNMLFPKLENAQDVTDFTRLCGIDLAEIVQAKIQTEHTNGGRAMLNSQATKSAEILAEYGTVATKAKDFANMSDAEKQAFMVEAMALVAKAVTKTRTHK